MAADLELKDSVSDSDLLTTDCDEPDESYSYIKCKKIGKDFLNELKQAVIDDNLPEIEDPRLKATKYLEETAILQLLEDLITKLVFKRPEKPIAFLVKEIEEIKRKGTDSSNGNKTAWSSDTEQH